MQKILALCFSLLLSAVYLVAQNPGYMLYERSCMDQLEYSNAATGKTVYVYSMTRQPGIQYYFSLAESGIKTAKLPDNYVKCAEAQINDAQIDAINTGRQQYYIVFQTAYGFSMYAVENIVRIQRAGAKYEVKGEQYHFAIDTTRLLLETNLAYTGSSHFVFYNGFRQQSCMRQYSFQLEPTQAGGQRSELYVIPSIGITFARTGNTPEVADKNQLRLQKINKVFIDEYISQRCPYSGYRSTMPTNTPSLTYGATAGKGISEVDKETAASMNKWGVTTPPTTRAGEYTYYTPSTGPGYRPVSGYKGVSTTQQTGLHDCPVPPGTGYHVVQPGDYLNGIADAYGVSLNSLLKWNKIKNKNHIEICQKIYVVDPASIPAQQPAVERQVSSKGVVAQNLSDVESQNAYWASAEGKTYKAVPKGEAIPNLAPIHIVQVGENLSSIARGYGVPETYLRKINNMPPTGNVTIYPGDTLWIVDCPPCEEQKESTRQPETSTNPYDIPATPAQDATNTEKKKEKMSQSKGFTERSVVAPMSSGGGDPSMPSNVATAYREHVVRQGETITSISLIYNISPEELARVNNVAVNETLIAGKRLQVPLN